MSDDNQQPAIYCDYCGWVDNPSRHLGTCPDWIDPRAAAEQGDGSVP